MLNSGASRPLAHWFVCYNIYFAAPLLEQRLYGPTVQMCLPDILSRSLTSPSFLFQLFFRRFFHEALSFAVFAFLERGNSTKSARFDNIGLISATILPRIIVSFTVLLLVFQIEGKNWNYLDWNWICEIRIFLEFFLSFYSNEQLEFHDVRGFLLNKRSQIVD